MVEFQLTETTLMANRGRNSGSLNGVGIFRGPVGFGRGRWGWFIGVIICASITFGLGWDAFLDGKLDVIYLILAILSLLFTIFLLVGFVNAFRQKRMARGFETEGIWLGENQICMGRYRLDLHKECVIAGLHDAQFTEVAHVTSLDGVQTVDLSEADITLTMVNSKYDSKVHRIVRAIVKQNGAKLCDYECMPAFLISEGKMYNCNLFSMIDQLKMLAKCMQPAQAKKRDIAKLCIALRAGLNVSTVASQGSLVHSLASMWKAGQAQKQLLGGNYVDEETGEYLRELSESDGWRLEVRPMRAGELGLGGEW